MQLFNYEDGRLQSIANFIEEERRAYPEVNNNRVAFALGTIFRRYRFARRLKQLANPVITVHVAETKRVFESMVSSLAADEALAESIHSTARDEEIKMLFESFFMHASVMCDEIVQLLLFFFGAERGVKMGSHRDLAKSFATYATQKGLSFPHSLPAHAFTLETELCDFRDKQIVHDFNARKLRGLSWGANNDICLSGSGFLYPKPTDLFSTSIGWDELLIKLDEYLWEILNVIRENRALSRLAQA